MSTTVKLQNSQSITIDKIVVETVRDLFLEKKIIARIKGIPRGIVLWQGEVEYTAAGEWSNASILARATEIISSGNVTFA